MVTYAQKALEDVVKPYECPSQCSNKPTDEDSQEESDYNYDNNTVMYQLVVVFLN